MQQRQHYHEWLGDRSWQRAPRHERGGESQRHRQRARRRRSVEDRDGLSPTDPGSTDQNNDNASIPNSDGGQTPLNAKGEYSLSGGDAADLPPGTYYFSKLTLSGGSTIRISGPTVIYVTGDVSLSGGSVTNATSLPKEKLTTLPPWETDAASPAPRRFTAWFMRQNQGGTQRLLGLLRLDRWG